MRLLNTSTFQLEIFESELARPPYAILSHTWGTDEVLFDDVSARSLDLLSITRKGGRAKVIGSCREARRNGYRLLLNRHLLHLQEQQLRALRGNQLHVSSGKLLPPCAMCILQEDQSENEERWHIL